MKATQMTLIFPPVHDFAMPYLSLPLFKGYIEEHTPVKCTIMDFNQKFFNKIISQNKKKKVILSHINAKDLKNSVSATLNLQKYAEKRIDYFLKDYPDYGLTLRKVKTSFNVTRSESIFEGVQSNRNLFHDIFSDFLSTVKFNNFHIFGISICVEDQIFPSFTLAKIIRERIPRAKIIMGGNIVTRLYENILKSKLCEYMDYLVIREGEDALLQLIKYYITEEITYLPSSKIISTKNMKINTEKLDKETIDIRKINTPDFSDYDLENYLSPIPILPIFITRRCSWAKCDFCSIYTSWDPVHRIRNMDRVMDDLETYVNKGVKYFKIVDEDCAPNILEKFSNKLLEKNFKIFFEAYSRFEKKFLKKTFCRKIAEAGCRQLLFGLESIGEKTLRTMRKGIKYPNQRDFVDEVLKNTSEAGILNYVFIIMGIPNAPIEDELKTVSYIIGNKNIHVIALASFVVDKDSPIHLNGQIREKYNIRLFQVGDMTTEIGYKVNGKDIRKSVQKRAIQYAKKIYENRPDLALASLINDELRFILTCQFGNNFAQSYISECNEGQIKAITEAAIKKCYEERVKRELKEDPEEKSYEKNNKSLWDI